MIIGMVSFPLRAALPPLLVVSFLLLTFAETLKIKASKVLNTNGTVVYEGNVTLFYGNRTLRCEKLKVVFLEENRITSAEALGNVVYSDNTTTVYADKAEYIPAKEEIIFEGNVLVKTDKGISSGDRLIYHLKSKTYELVGSSEVKTVINLNTFRKEKNATGEENATSGKR